MTKWTIFDKNWKIEKNALASQKMTKLSIFDKIVWYITTPSVYIVFFYTYLIIWSPRFKNDKMDHFWQKMKNWKNALASQKMTKLCIFDKTEEVKKYTGLSENDKLSIFDKIVWYITTHTVHIEYLYLSHNLKSTFQKWQNGPFLTKIEKLKKMHWPLRKWQNWAFLTKLKKRKNTRASHKMTKWAIFDNFEKVKKLHGPLRKWQNWAFLTK